MKITLREMFLVVLVVALALGWWLDRTRLATRALGHRDLATGFALLLQINDFSFDWSDGKVAVSISDDKPSIVVATKSVEALEELKQALGGPADPPTGN